MSISLALAIEARLQLSDSILGQNQGVVVEDVVDIGTSSRKDVDTLEVASGLTEPSVDGFAVDHEHLACEPMLFKVTFENLGFGVFQLKLVDHHQAILGFGAERHLQTQCTDLLVERLLELLDLDELDLEDEDLEEERDDEDLLLLLPLLFASANSGIVPSISTRAIKDKKKIFERRILIA